MRNLVLASLLGSAVAGVTVPVLAGPIHIQVTKPFSMLGTLPASGVGPSAVTLGAAPPAVFVITDVLIGGEVQKVVVTSNGAPVFCSGYAVTGTGVGWISRSRSENLTSGFMLPPGATVGVTASNVSDPTPVTLVGYLQ